VNNNGGVVKIDGDIFSKRALKKEAKRTKSKGSWDQRGGSGRFFWFFLGKRKKRKKKKTGGVGTTHKECTQKKNEDNDNMGGNRRTHIKGGTPWRQVEIC